jgi:general secretion pathway protein I
MSRARDRSAAGFTLVEVLVALAILGLVMTAVFRLFGTGARSVAHVHDQLQLALVAETLLARVGVDLDPGTGALTGRLPDGMTWRIERDPWLEKRPPPPPGRSPAAKPRADAGASGPRRIDMQRAEVLPPDQAGAEAVGGLGGNGGKGAQPAKAPPQLWRVRVTIDGADGRHFGLDTLRLVELKK